MENLRYFEIGLGNSVEEDWETFDYSICIRAKREPKTFEEVNTFLKSDIESLGYKTAVSITEITEDEAYADFNFDNCITPIFE